MKCDGCGQEKKELHLLGVECNKQQFCDDCLGTKDSHISMRQLGTEKIVETPSNIHTLIYDFGTKIYKEGIKRGCLETAKRIIEDIETANYGLHSGTGIVLGEKDWNELKEIWLEEKQKAKK